MHIANLTGLFVSVAINHNAAAEGTRDRARKASLGGAAISMSFVAASR
ncbi:MAG: hypothetical protein ACRYG4_17890 [Janthinobacterium lividum]